jgi:hypothetical protein
MDEVGMRALSQGLNDRNKYAFGWATAGNVQEARVERIEAHA